MGALLLSQHFSQRLLHFTKPLPLSAQTSTDRLSSSLHLFISDGLIFLNTSSSGGWVGFFFFLIKYCYYSATGTFHWLAELRLLRRRCQEWAGRSHKQGVTEALSRDRR